MNSFDIINLEKINFFKQMNIVEFEKSREHIETLDIQKFNLLFLNVNNDVKKRMIDDKILFDKIMQIPPTRHKKLIIELVSEEIKDYILRSEYIKESLYAKRLLINYFTKLNYDTFSKFITTYDFHGKDFGIDIEKEINRFMINDNLKKLLNNNRQFNSLFLIKIKNKYELYIYTKFNILVEVKSSNGKDIFFDDNVFIDYNFLINVNKSHITKLLVLLKRKNDNYNNTELFVSVIKLYMIFGYDNSKKIIEDFYTYATSSSLQKASYELYKDLRREFRLNNQHKFYYYGIEKDILKSLKNRDYKIFNDICLLSNECDISILIEQIENRLSTTKSSIEKEKIVKEFILEQIEKRESYYKKKDIRKYYKCYEMQVKTTPLTVREIYNLFSKTNLKVKLNSKGQIIEDRQLLKFLLGNFKKDNDCLLRLILNRQALGLNDELYNIINNYHKIMKEIRENKELSMYSLLDIIDISKVLLYKLKPDELDITLNTLSKILNSRKYMNESPEDILERVLELHKLRKKKIYSTYPQIKGKIESNKFEVVPFSDESLLSAGIDGGDCLKVGAAGEEFLKYCLISPNGGIMYLYYENVKYIIPFSKNGNMININSIDPRIHDKKLAYEILNCIKNIGLIWINYPESGIEIVTITDIHLKEFMENINLDTIEFTKSIPLNTKMYTDYNKEDVINYIVVKKDSNTNVNYDTDSNFFYQERSIPYVYDINNDNDKERIQIFINNIAYSSIDYEYDMQEEKDFYKENYKLLNADDYFYIIGSKDWFIAISYDYTIISYILPFDKRAVYEYEEALRNITKSLPKLKKMIKKKNK